jgi:hypothetical protein
MHIRVAVPSPNHPTGIWDSLVRIAGFRPPAEEIRPISSMSALAVRNIEDGVS